MTFLWPTMLWLLLAVPLLALTAWWVGRRRASIRHAYPGLGRVAGGGDARGVQGRRRRGPRLPWVLYLIGLTALFVAAARPSAVVMVPRLNQTVLLALDASLSMRAGDVKPSRLEAVQGAARRFIESQPADTRIGVISFAATASVVQMPTVVRADTLAAVDRLSLQRGTAIGSAILVALGVLFPQEDFERMLTPGSGATAGNAGSAGSAGSAGGGNRPGAAGGTGAEGREGREGANVLPNLPGSSGANLQRSDLQRRDRASRMERVEPGSHDSAAIVVITDGQSTVGPLPAEAARLAADAGVRVYTVGVGTPGGEVIEGDGWKVRVKLDDSVLKDVASQTRGEFFLAESAADLNRISRSLGTRFVLERKETEISSWFTAAGALLILVATLLSLRRSNRIL